jgi:hypothetical protein
MPFILDNATNEVRVDMLVEELLNDPEDVCDVMVEGLRSQVMLKVRSKGTVCALCPFRSYA